MRSRFHVQVQSVIETALQTRGPARVLVIKRMCAGNRALLREVVSLLPHYRKLRGFQSSSPLGALWSNAGSTTFIRRLSGESAAGPPDVDAPPVYVDQYCILNVIGKGGMGIVYRGEHMTTGHLVAIKMLRCRNSSATARRRFAYEAEILRPLLHPGIARMIYANTFGDRVEQCRRPAEAGRHYFVMEYVKGLPLTEYARRSQLGTLGRLRLLAKVCEIVDYAHHRGIIHLDLKPSNILVDDTGQPKILDFGIAQVAATSILGINDGHVFAGTPEYASPEQLAGRLADLTARSDVYSLGLVAHQLLTGKLPHRRNSQAHVDVSGLQTPSSERNPCFDENSLIYFLTATLAKALDPLEQRRYRSAGELGADLTAILSSFWPETSWSIWRRNIGELLRSPHKSLMPPAPSQNSSSLPNPLAGPLSTVMRMRITASMRSMGRPVQD